MKTLLITGASSGLGYELARQVVGAGHQVILACRDAERAAVAASRIAAQRPAEAIHTVLLDLTALDSIDACAQRVGERFERVDVLVNNAGVMLPVDPERRVHGAEHHFGVNFLGHFALTAGLMNVLRASPAPRVVHVTSMSARYARLDLSAIDAQRGLRAYGVSKLANLMFAMELARRAAAIGLRSIACQPGYVATPLTRNLWLARLGKSAPGPFAAVRGSIADAREPRRYAGDRLICRPDMVGGHVWNAASGPPVSRID